MPKIDLLAAPTLLPTHRWRLCVPNADCAQSFADEANASMPVLEHVDWGPRPRDLAWALRYSEYDARCAAVGQGLVFHVVGNGQRR